MDWAIKNWHLLGSRSDEDAHKAGKYRWKDHRDERAEVGDGVHNYLEALQTGSWNFPENLDEEQLAILDQYSLLAEEYDIEPLRNEITAANIGDGWFGTLDSYCRLNGIPTLVDFKTSKSVQEEHRMQLAALANADEWFIETEEMVWETIEPEPIEQVALFHLRADVHEIVFVDDLDLYYDKFLAYKDAWYINEALRKRAKERESN